MCNTIDPVDKDIIDSYDIPLCSDQVTAIHLDDFHETQWREPEEPALFTASTSEIMFKENLSHQIVIRIHTNNITNSTRFVFESRNCNFTVEVNGLRHTFYHSCPTSR